MTVERLLFTGAAAFAAVVGAVYWLASAEHAGTTMLASSGAGFLLVAAYLTVVGRRVGPRPSDRPDAGYDADEGAPQWYPARSVWPFSAAAGATGIGFGLVFGLGVASLGVLLLVASVAGYAAEANAKT